MISSIERRYSDRTDYTGGWSGELLGFQLISPIAEEARDQALAIISAAMTSIDRESLGRELYRLRSACKAQAVPDLDLRLWLELVGEECQRYPVDVVIWVLRKWAADEVFTPALSELRRELNRNAAPRHSLLEAIRCAPTQGSCQSDAWRYLQARIGIDAFSRWFDKVEVKSVANGTVTLEARSRFSASFIKTNFMVDLCAAWKHADATVDHVDIVVK